VHFLYIATARTGDGYFIGANLEIGLENHSEMGELGNAGHLNQLSRTLHAVIDTKTSGWRSTSARAGA
jgi:hypothetical protein